MNLSNRPIRDRKYLAFLSHAHADKAIVDQLYYLLARTAGLPIWYDSASLQASKSIVSELPIYISQCRAVILILSQASIKSGWVKEEYSYALNQRALNSRFRIIPIRIDNCAVPGFLETTKWIDLSDGKITFNNFYDILLSFYDHDISLDFQKTKDLYISRSWRDSELELPNDICKYLFEFGFHLVGDSDDQSGFEQGNRVASIMKSCGGVVAVVPNRGNGTTSKYILKEIELAQGLNLPVFVVADCAVHLPTIPNLILIKEEENTPLLQTYEFKLAVEELFEQWRRPLHPHYIFFATNLDKSNIIRNERVRQLVQSVTGMACVIGEDIRGDHLQKQIQDRIANAFIMISDISEDNLNTSIEAGIARGANTKLHLLAKEPRKRPPFMFRDLQVFYYADDLELLAVVHRLLHPYRRHVINSEIE